MKASSDKLKKEKSPLLKPHTAIPHKKTDSKKQSAKKEDLVIPKSTKCITQPSALATCTIKPVPASHLPLNHPNSLIPQLQAARIHPKLVSAKRRVLLAIIN
jgi:hypothetical protein